MTYEIGDTNILFVNYGIVDLIVGRTSLGNLIPGNKNSSHTIRLRVLQWKNCDIKV